MLTKSQKKELDKGLNGYYSGKLDQAVADEALEARRQMLQLSDEDIKAGRLISQQDLDKQDLDWLRNYKFD